MMEPVTWKPGMGLSRARNRNVAPTRGRGTQGIWDEAIRVEAEQVARSYGVRLADDDSTFAAKVRMVIWSKADYVVDVREDERAKRLPPIRRTRKTKKGLQMTTEQCPEFIGDRSRS